MSRRFHAPPALLALLGLVAGPAAAVPALPSAGPLQGATTPAPNRVDYDIRARLDGETKRLDASETIRWTNRTGVPTSELHFHLYLNAFSSNRTTFAVEGGARHRDGEWGWQRVTALGVGGNDVLGTLEYVDADPAVTPTFSEGEPYLAEEDRSVFKVTLPEPVASGETITIELTWESQLPRVRRRTGYKGDFLLVAQWFPKLGVFEGDRGWNCHQFHTNTEFYSDYGTYRVALDLPGIYEGKVGGSGRLVSSTKLAEERVEVVFEAPTQADRERADQFGKLPVVHDFTWTADPSYIVDEYRFSFEEWAARSEAHRAEYERMQALAPPGQRVELRDVDVTVLIHPERRGQSLRHFEATANALYFYGVWFGEYPYEHITVVDPIWGDNRAGGMEYPTLFTAGTGLHTTPDMYRPESVTVHEAGHQFWYGLVGNNEFEAAWMDEGFNSFTDSEALLLAYGPQRSTTSYSRYPFDGVRPAALPDGGNLGAALNGRRYEWSLSPLRGVPVLGKLAKQRVSPLRGSGPVDWWRDQPLLTLVRRWDDPRWGDRGGYLAAPDSDPIDRPAWTYLDRSSYRTNSYPRPAVALRSLAGVVGREDFYRAMRAYAAEWRYRHPYPDDFFETFSREAGQDLSWYWEDAFRSVKTIDWSVSVTQSRPAEPEGFFTDEEGRFAQREEEPEEEGAEDGADEEEGAEDEEAGDEEAGDEAAEEESSAEPARPWRIEITLRRRGELCLPLPWRVTYEDGTTEDFVWSREAQLEQPWWRYRAEGSRKIRSVVLDPERVYYFDEDMSDNQWYERGDVTAPVRWSERVLNQYGHLLHWYAGIGG
jgi:hypothetical protein